MSQMSDTLPINHAQTTIGKAPIAQMVAAIKSEPLQSDGPRCGPGQAKLQCQAKAGATAANIRKCHGELLRQRAEKSANPAPATLITIVTPTQQEQQPKPRLMGQKLGFAALTEDSWQPEQLSSEAAEDSGEASPGIAVDTPSTQHVPNLYTCEKCSRNYTFRRGLTRHTREHPNCDVELPTATTKALFEADRYACQKCSKSYSKKKSLNKHQRDHPNCESKTPDAGDDTEAEVGLPIETAGPNPLSERERYACEKCGKTYSRRHTVRIHQRENPNCETDGPSNSGTLRVPRAAAAPKKSAPKAQSDLPAAFPVFNSNHKRPVGQIPVGTLFYPGQIVSKQKYDAKRQRRHDRREKHEMKQGSMADQGLETIVFDDFDASEAGADPFDEEQDQEGPPFAIDGDLATETFDDNIATEIEVSQRPEATNSGNPPRTDFKVNNSPAFSNAARRSSQSLRGANQLEVVAVKSPATAHHNAEQQSGQTLHFQGTQPAIVTLPKAPNKQPAIAAELNASQVSEVESGDSDDLTFISAAPRPKVAGKGISAATLAAWEGDEDGQVPNIVYEYWVMRRQWATTLSVEDIVEATERTLGPFHTVAEANVVAIKEIYPTRNESEGQLTLTGWSYSCKHDADGLQTHNAEVAGLHIETLVSRGTFPPAG